MQRKNVGMRKQYFKLRKNQGDGNAQNFEQSIKLIIEFYLIPDMRN